MNKKVILTRKAILSTVMASSVACSTFTTSIYAQTSEAEVKELENEVEKVIPESGNDGDKTQENEMMPDSVVEESEITSFDGETVLLQNLDYAKLDSAIAQVESGLEDESKYTPETWANFKPVYDKAKGAKSDGSLTQEDVDQLASDLISAYVDWYYVKKMDKLNREFDHLINLVP